MCDLTWAARFANKRATSLPGDDETMMMMNDDENDDEMMMKNEK